MTTYVTRADAYRVSGLPSDGSVISTSDMDTFITFAIDFFQNSIYGTYIYQASNGSDAQSVTETYDGNGQRYFYLDHFPIVSLTSLSINGVSVTPSNVYITAKTGRLELKDSAEAGVFDRSKPQLISVTYTYGELTSQRVVDFTAAIAAQRALVAQLGGSWTTPTSFSVPEMSGSTPGYSSIREALDRVNAIIQANKDSIRVKAQFG